MSLPLSVGFELEFEGATLPASQRKSYEGNPLRGMTGWRLKTDASCGPSPSAKGLEVLSPVFRDETALQEGIDGIIVFLAEHGARLNQRCGLHVHLGFPDVEEDSPSMRRLLMFLIRYEAVFYALCPAHRRENEYCAPIREHIMAALNEDEERAANAWKVTPHFGPRGKNRFHWLNACSFYNHGTLEFRMPESTFNPADIRGWIDFLVHVCDNVVHRRPHPNAPKVVAAKSRSGHVALLIHELLQKTDSYGGKATNTARAERARKWVHHRFKTIHHFSYRTALNKMTRDKKAS